MVGSREARSMPLITFFSNTDALLDAYCKVLELSLCHALGRKGRVAKKRASEKSFLNISARPLPRIKMSKCAVKEGYSRSPCLFEATCVTKVLT